MGRFMLISAISWAIQVLTWIIIIDAVLTFFPTVDRRNPIVMLLRSITDVICRPIRKVISPVRMGEVGLDLSPLIAILGIQFIGSIVIRLIAGIMR